MTDTQKAIEALDWVTGETILGSNAIDFCRLYGETIRRALKLAEAVEGVLELVNKQAEDEGLWFDADYVTEAYLQRNLRELHVAIEAAPQSHISALED